MKAEAPSAVNRAGAPSAIAKAATRGRKTRISSKLTTVPGKGLKNQEVNQGEDGHAEKEGVGLGLAIAKYIIELHKGKIWAENIPGGGSRFSFVLPGGTKETT